MNDIAVRVGQVWRDNLNDRLLTVVAITTPSRSAVDNSVWVRDQTGRGDVYAATYFGRLGKRGFTLVTAGSAITDQRIAT